VPSSGTCSGKSSSTTNAGTFTTVTERTLPSTILAIAVTTPTAVSIVTTVSGPRTGTMPASSTAVTAQMVLEPDMGVKPPCSRTTMPKSDPSFTGGRRMTEQRPG
jgi:hypothetical protein